MFVVHFFENKNLSLIQLLHHVPSVGEDLRIKGHKGKVSNVNRDERNIHVQVILENMNKNKVTVDKKKKR
ncbi:hypothetical protein [Bacillus sp. FSL K6-3431]|uniref:hypothetical protein n=1 Tax=Bacillus sp. FSL K6-3431 TaxID=2921500 RepID=UPI0030FA9AEE